MDISEIELGVGVYVVVGNSVTAARRAQCTHTETNVALLLSQHVAAFAQA